MMKRILVPLDGSTLAERALPVAAKLARSTEGALILVQALSDSTTYASPLVPQIVPVATDEEIQRAQAYLTEKARLPVLSGLSVETVVLAESPALSILDAASEYRADMIVMTSHGRTGVSRWVLGSVAGHVARQAQVPVLMLRQHQLPFWTNGAELVAGSERPGQVATVPPLRVLVPLDGSPLAESALEPAASCAQALVHGVEAVTGSPSGSIPCLLDLVLVVRPFDRVAENIPEVLVVASAEGYLKRAAAWVEVDHPGVRVGWEVVQGGDVAGTLIAIAAGTKPAEDQDVLRSSAEDGRGRAVREESSEYTLLAMATHGRTGVTRWVWGSIAERVVLRTELPVLLVHPQQSQPA